MSTKHSLRFHIATLLVIMTSLSLFSAMPSWATVTASYADILRNLGFNSGDVSADLDSMQKSLGVPTDGNEDGDTISLLEAIGANGNKSEKQFQLQKKGSEYQMVIVETIPVSAADIGSLTQFARPAEDVFSAGAEEDPEISVLEAKMVEMVNKERTARGLNPLEIDQRLLKTARMKSQDIVDNNYFSHDSPTYGTPFELMKSQGIRYAWAGENLAGAPTLETAFKNLMNSEPHRNNILNPHFSKIGIGIALGSKYQMVFTQHFIGY